MTPGVPQPKISVVLPVYNVEKYIDACLTSLTGQTLREIEILCVDDASNDGTLARLNRWCAKDARIRVLTHSETLTAGQSRKDGVIASSGEYVMFVDPDDVLEADACRQLYALAGRHRVDILHFTAAVVGEQGVSEQRIIGVANQLLPYHHKITSGLVEACFVQGLFSYQLWNKIYRGDVVRAAMRDFPDGALPKAQDLLAFYIILDKAQSYRGVQTEPLYRYFLGRGVTGGGTLNARQIWANACQGRIPLAIRTYNQAHGCTERYGEAADAIHKRLLRDSLTRFSLISQEEMAYAWETMQAEWGIDEIVGGLSCFFPYQQEVWAQRLTALLPQKVPAAGIKTVASFYHSLANGGAQRVVALLAELWVQMGYQVVLFTDTEPEADEYPVPDEAVRIPLPVPEANQLDGRIQRSRIIREAVEQYHIDALVYHAWVSNQLLFDMVSAQSAGAKVIIHCHNVFSMPLLSASISNRYFSMPKVYALADAVLTLSSTDSRYWQNYNNKVMEVRNPMTFQVDVSQAGLNGQTILWVGRMSAEKRPVQVVEIFRRVAEQLPEARLVMVGTGTEAMEAAVQNAVVQYGLEEKVSLEGFQTELSHYYRDADVFLCTSQYEGAPMTLIEAQCHGLPVVCYDMPYLAVLSTGLGTATVPQEDKDGAAREIIRLLEDRALLNTKGAESRANVLEHFNIDLAEQWRRVFALTGEEHTRNALPKDGDARRMVDTISSHVQYRLRRSGGAAAVPEFAPLPAKGPLKLFRKKTVTFLRVLLIDGLPGVREVFRSKKTQG